MSIQFVPADRVNFDALTSAFNLAYSDYMVPLQLTPESLRAANRQTDTDYARSVAALSETEIVGLGFLAVRGEIGWIGGMGVIPDYRRRGIGQQMMQVLLHNAKDAGLKTVLLEVIEGNEAAHQLYLNLGFEPVRRLLIIQANEIHPFNSEIDVQTVSASEALEHYDALHTVRNPWQRVRQSLEKADDLTGWLAYSSGQPTAYVIGRITKHMIQIMDVGLAPSNTQALQALIAHISQQKPETPASMVNLTEEDPAWPVMHEMGFEERLAQIEMQITF